MYVQSVTPAICLRTRVYVLQVRAVVDLLPNIEVVENDPFNSSPTDPKYMGPDVLQRFRKGEKLAATTMRTPLVSVATSESKHNTKQGGIADFVDLLQIMQPGVVDAIKTDHSPIERRAWCRGYVH